MEGKKSRVFVCATFPKNLDLESFKELEYTEVTGTTNIPNESAPFLLCPICDTILVCKVDNYPIFYYHCSQCSVNYKIEANKKETKKMYKCPECNIPLNESMFCVKCCSKWLKTTQGEIDKSNESFIQWSCALNNGGDTDYYLIPDNAKYCQDIIESRKMNFSQGNIFKAAFCFGIKRGNSDYERDLNKIIWFANRELERIKT